MRRPHTSIDPPPDSPRGQPKTRLGTPLDQTQREALAAGFSKILDRRHILTGTEELALYDCDAYTLVKAEPDFVVLPGDTEAVAAIVKLCAANNVPYIARGSGTGLSGGALAMAGGVVIGLNRMNRILEIDRDAQTALVEVGVINAWLNRAVAGDGLFYAPDPSSQSACTIGGNIAENAGGIHCVKYGVTVDHVLALEIVLPDGEIVWSGSQSRRQLDMNLTGLMVGSEGTLGVVTRAVLRLLKKPAATKVFLAAFNHVADATDTVNAVMSAGLAPSALEFMDAFTVRAVNEAFDVGFPEAAQAVLLIELDGASEAMAHRESCLRDILNTHGASSLKTGESEAERLALWKARKGTVAAYGRYYPSFYLNDCVIPRSELTRIMAEIEAITAAHGVPIANVFHAGDGNLHPHILFDARDEAMLPRVMAAGEAILHACLAVGGVLSGEHGIGIEKSGFMDAQFSPDDLARMMAVKPVFDPLGLANPAKIFPVRSRCGETKLTLTHAMLAANDLWV